MTVLIISILWTFWITWWYFYGTEHSSIIWLLLVVYWIGSQDLAWSSELILISIILYFCVNVKWSLNWVGWSEYTFNVVLVTSLILTLSLLYLTDWLLVFIIIESLHLLMAIMIMTDRNYHRILLFIIIGWTLSILILLTMPSVLIIQGNIPTINLTLNSIMGWPNIMLLLVLGKLYILPWSLLGVVVYSGVSLATTMMLSLTINLNFAIMLGLIGSYLSDPYILCLILSIVCMSLILVSIALCTTTLLNVFVGYSFSITVHMLLVYCILDGIGFIEMLSMLLTIYIPMSILLVCIVQQVSSTTLLDSLDGLSNIHSTHGLLLLITILIFFGIPPSLIFGLKVGFLYTLWLSLPLLFVGFVLLTVIVGYSYLRLVFRILAITVSTKDIVNIESTDIKLMVVATLGMILILSSI